MILAFSALPLCHYLRLKSSVLRIRNSPFPFEINLLFLLFSDLLGQSFHQVDLIFTSIEISIWLGRLTGRRLWTGRLVVLEEVVEVGLELEAVFEIFHVGKGQSRSVPLQQFHQLRIQVEIEAGLERTFQNLDRLREKFYLIHLVDPGLILLHDQIQQLLPWQDFQKIVDLLGDRPAKWLVQNPD